MKDQIFRDENSSLYDRRDQINKAAFGNAAMVKSLEKLYDLLSEGVIGNLNLKPQEYADVKAAFAKCPEEQAALDILMGDKADETVGKLAANWLYELLDETIYDL